MFILNNRMWPSSFPLIVAMSYLFVFLIRPWEQILPWLKIIHFERIYLLFLLFVVCSTNKKSFKGGLLSFWVVMFFFAICISAFFSYHPGYSWDNNYRYFVLLIFYFVLLLIVQDLYGLIFVFMTYISTMAIYLAKSQWEFFFHGSHYFRMGVKRLIGIEQTYGGPNDLAMSIAVSLPIAFFLWRFRKAIVESWTLPRKKYFTRFILLYFYLSFSSIVLTNSRSGFVTLIAFMLLIALRSKNIFKNLGFIIVVGVALLSIWFVMPDENRNRISTIWAPERGPQNAQSSAEGRIEGFYAGIEMFKRFPVLGVGPACFTNYRVANVDGVPLQAHNLLGQILGEIGIFGTLPFCMAIIVSLRNCREIRKKGSSNDASSLDQIHAGIAIAIRDTIFLLIFSGLFSHNLYRYNWLWSFAFIGILTKVINSSVTEKSMTFKG